MKTDPVYQCRHRDNLQDQFSSWENLHPLAVPDWQKAARYEPGYFEVREKPMIAVWQLPPEGAPPAKPGVNDVLRNCLFWLATSLNTHDWNDQDQRDSAESACSAAASLLNETHMDAVDAVRARLDELGLKQQDLANIIGSKSRASEFMNRRHPPTLSMVREIHKHLNIPLNVLLDI